MKISAVKRLVDVLYAQDNTTFSSKAELFEVAKLYGSLYDFSYPNRQDVLRFNVYLEKLENKIDEEENIKKKDITKLLKSLTPTCEETLLRCHWKGTPFNCSSLFRMDITQFGFCCVFNYYNTEAGRLEKDPLDPVDKPIRMSDSSRLNSLTLVMQAKTEEYLYATRQSYGFDILFFDRYDYADQTAGGLVHRVISVGQHYDITISPYSYYTVPAVRRLPLEKRGCKFEDEMKEEYHEYYSMSNCLVRCRMRTIERLCRCVPFFLPKRSNLSACTLEELHCLNKYRQKLLFVYPPSDLPGLEVEQRD
ncbi:sodium channel protein Nach-like [Choristoneura fumiferana]|uniref:sodium channel protein Nach-like n=1 Tax=Choristoneura fumiferana TaxID=7141 RepID=UPI003D1576F7